MKKVILLIVLAAVAAGGFVGYKKFRSGRVDDTDAIVLYGNVDIRSVDLGFRVAGKIAEIKFEEGDKAGKGDILAVLDRVPFEHELELANAQKDSAAALLEKLQNGSRPQEIIQAQNVVDELLSTLKTIELEYERFAALVDAGRVSRQSFDDITARKDATAAKLESARQNLSLIKEGPRKEDIAVAAASLAAAQAGFEIAKVRLSDTSLIAPTDGIILTRAQEPGAIVAAGQTVASLSVENPVWVRAYISEPDLGRIYPGMAAEIFTDTHPDKPYTGHIGFISPEAEFTPKNVETAKLRTDLVYRLRIIADNPDHGLRQGMPVTVRLDLTQKPLAASGGDKK